MRIRVWLSDGIGNGYCVKVPVETLEEAAKYLTETKWVSAIETYMNREIIIFTSQIVSIEKE